MRVVGLETEYGIADPAEPRANPILMSARLVAACRDERGRTSRWDYGEEDPLQDLRGMRRSRLGASSDLLTDAPGAAQHGVDSAGRVSTRRRRGLREDPAHLNAVLTNGARFYVDHAHPEYSSPEVASARDAVAWDRAGEAIALAAAARYAENEGSAVHLYKNNVDGKGASYGTHENFLVARAVPFDTLAARITPHLVTRQVFTGSGRVGLGQRGHEPGFQLSQRADYIEAEVALETTMNRPIVNTRDEPHADRSQWRRLHVILGDANCFEVPTYLKIGTTSLVLAAIEADDERLDALRLADPVPATQMVSRDLALTARLPLASGESATALEIQRALIEICTDHVQDADDVAVLHRWREVVETLGRDPRAASKDVEWVAKLDLLTRMRQRYGGEAGVPWDDPRIVAADLTWGRLGDGLAFRLAASGAARRVVTDQEITDAAQRPPRNTRAWVRGEMVRRSDDVESAGWATVVLDRDDSDDLVVVHLTDPAATSHPALVDDLRG